MNKKIIIIPIVLLLGVLIIYNIISKRPYESRYFEKLGIDRDSVYFYRDMLKDFGEPKEVTPHGYSSVFVNYDDFGMVFYSTDDDAVLLSIRITGRKYRFGWYSIGIGSTKDEVFRAYKELTHYQEYDFYACVDGGISVEFYFDDYNIVNKIEFSDYTRGM